MRNYVFIGGTKRGFELLKALVKDFGFPSLAYILQEDNHEADKYSERLEGFLQGKCYSKTVKKLQEEDYFKIMQDHYDFAVVCGWRTFIDLNKLDKYFKHGLLAAHDSLLPKYRGFAPTNWAIINGEKECGVSVFKINDGEVDSGDIYSQNRVDITDEDNINSVMNKVTQATIDGYKHIFNHLENIQPIVQNHSDASYTCKRRPSDGVIDWHKSSKEVFNLMRALFPPYPSSFTNYGGEKLFIHDAQIGRWNDRDYVGRIPGKVISISEEGVEVLCGSGSILITLVEYKGLQMNPKDLIKTITYTFDNEHNH